ncbi:unnamed protein product [Microthlaspi erraticum]|uniref:Uncharacterized protein n=1 Tax=Microthlaspi erraticum TaxID=1685480 RepID=A0A6D2KER4_9BRAS|nr:unnamed protein product [Microthlaspi erraticum]
MFRARPKPSVRLKSRPKFKTVGRSRITTRETKPAVGHATPHRARPTARAGKRLAAAQLITYHGRRRPTGKLCPRPAEKPSANFTVRPQPADRSSGPDRSDSAKDPTVRPTVPTTVRTPRSTRSRF